ncbi:MAG TPA: alpha/beta hydrolase-fold protein [Candidatus Caenarcaniphilales bacterium]|nr:alpha/beta hydrolase-fold protein [Candidatus Caenarcaniphilales bacterium]
MKRESRLWFSRALGHDMELLVYGHAGQPLLALPSQDGRAADWEGFGMVDAVADLIEAGRLTLIAVDGVDWQSWTNAAAPVDHRARRHEDYHRYLVEDVVPFARAETGRESVWLTGCSMGAFHAANLFFRRPDAADGVIAMSGLYQPRLFVGDYSDDHVYFNSPLYYLPGLSDPWHLEHYRRSRIVFCVGQGAWEDEALADTRKLQELLQQKNVPATFDYWGHDVEHHWYWWQKMLRHHLQVLWR